MERDAMNELIKNLPDIITAAAQSYLGILALLSVALSVLAYLFFARASDKVKVGIFVLLFLGVAGFGTAMFRVSVGGPKGAGADASMHALSEQAKVLLTAAAQDPGGLVLYERFGPSVDLHTNGESLFTDKADHRAMATWEAALQDLVDDGLFAARGDEGEVFEITQKGYEVAATLTK